MLYKTIIAAFVVSSGDALRIEGLSTRRAVIGTASALLVPLAAFAEEGKLKRAGDAEIYARADDGKLSAARVRTLILIKQPLNCTTHLRVAPASPDQVCSSAGD